MQISNDLLGYGELLISAVGGIGLLVLGYLSLRRPPPIPSETQQVLNELSENFAQHLKDDEKRFADLWSIANETQTENKIQAGDIKVQIAGLKLASAEGQTEIKVQLGKMATSISYIEAEIKRGFVEDPK